MAWSCRRPERFGEQPWVSSYVLAVDVQLLAYPQIREIHVLEGCFQRLMKIEGRERDWSLPFPSLALFSACHVHHDAVVYYFLAAADKSRTAAENH